MEYTYKIVITNNSLYKEYEFLEKKNIVKVGTEIGCDFRLHKSNFFDSLELVFININGVWSIACSDNIYISVGDGRKLLKTTISYGDSLDIKYRESDNFIFNVEFLIDFEQKNKKFKRFIDIADTTLISIGNSLTNNIVISGKYVTDDKITLERTNSGVYDLVINKTKYGIYHNGIKIVDKCQVKNGDFIMISDYCFYMSGQTLFTEIRKEMKINGLSYKDSNIPDNYPEFYRNPRMKIVVNKDKIQILDPPDKPKKNKANLFITLFPSMGMLLTSGLMASMGGGMMMFGIISAVFSIITALVTAFDNYINYKKECRNRIEKYYAYIDNKRSELEELHNQERSSLQDIYMDENIESRKIKDFSRELFDRQREDEDFLCVRLGTGSIKSLREFDYKKQEKIELEDELQVLPKKISEEYSILHNAPVVCDLKMNNCVGITGKEEYRFAIFKNIVLDICSRHLYSDVKLFFVSSEKNKEKIEWLRFLPFVYNEKTDFRNIACDDESKNRIFDFLYNEIAYRSQKKEIEENQEKSYVVFFYDDYGFQNHPISKYAHNLKEYRMTFVFMGEKKDRIPQQCRNIIDLESDKIGYLLNAENNQERIKFEYSQIETSLMKKMVEILAPVYTEDVSLERTLTKNISLYEMLNIFSVDDLDLSERWSKSIVYKSMAAPIGVTRMGILNLDLHDKAHGPHGLVAGTTGSGKSEVLQTFILTVATLYHPHEISFVIIDFKGGGMANQFKDLPHLLGAITNIDGKEINRSLKSINAEIQKRQRLFAEADVNHIDKYIKKFKEGIVKTPLPHLILIVDEFAELKAEQPDFMNELISAARIGRSLGIHLILATQKPAGQVDDQIWSNSRFKLCLKVQNPEDSVEVIKTPLAAEIKEPGRAYFQVGNNEIFELFQSAYSGASSKESENVVKEFSIYEVSVNGKRKLVYEQKKRKDLDNNLTQLDSIVKYVKDYCEYNKIDKLSNICMPPLSDYIAYPNMHRTKTMWTEIGIFDDPDNQKQDTAKINLVEKNTIIMGASQHGKTNLLQSIIKTIALTNSSREANIYIIDFDSMILKNYETMKHVGGVVASTEDVKFKNLLKLLIEEISERKKKFISAGVSSHTSYIDAGYKDVPHIYVLIDNLISLLELYQEEEETLLNIIREGLSAGISVVATITQMAGVSYRYLSNFGNKIALFCNDSNEYNNLFDFNTVQPDNKIGRCIFEQDKRILECQTYLAFEGEKEIERVRKIQEFIIEINNKNDEYKAKVIPYIPGIITREEFYSNFKLEFDEYRIPMGLKYSDVKPFYLDLTQIGIIGVCGKENLGHRNFIDNIIDCLESDNTSTPYKLVIIDDISRKYEYLNEKIECDYTLNIEEVRNVISEWYDVLNIRYESMLAGIGNENKQELLILIAQNNDVARVINDDFELNEKFNEMITRFRGLNCLFVFTNYQNVNLSYDSPEPLRIIKQEQRLLYFEDLDDLKVFDVSYDDIRANKRRLETGDAYYIEDNNITKIKVVKAD